MKVLPCEKRHQLYIKLSSMNMDNLWVNLVILCTFKIEISLIYELVKVLWTQLKSQL